jgi:hypothetical protein
MACSETGFDGTVPIIFCLRFSIPRMPGNCENPLRSKQYEQRGNPSRACDGESGGGCAALDGGARVAYAP